MLSIFKGTTSCARLTQSFSRFGFGASRGYAKVPATVKEKKPRIDKSEAPPKRPMGSYARFILEHKHLVKSDENAFQALSSKWGEMSAVEKKKYDPTPQQWEQYYEELGQWKETADPEVVKAVNQLRKKKGLKPIRTTKLFANSYAIFLKEHYTAAKAQGGEFEGIVSMSKGVAEKWRTMSDEEKQVYKVKADEAKKEWQRTHGKAEGQV